ncbi:hypothetical protein NPIL_156451, partial [Nephila pilipes]
MSGQEQTLLNTSNTEVIRSGVLPTCRNAVKRKRE